MAADDVRPEQARPPSPREHAAWYAFAAVTYVAAGIWQKGLLNWFVGPAWLVVVVTSGPAAVDRLRAVGRRPGRP